MLTAKMTFVYFLEAGVEIRETSLSPDQNETDMKLKGVEAMLKKDLQR